VILRHFGWHLVLAFVSHVSSMFFIPHFFCSPLDICCIHAVEEVSIYIRSQKIGSEISELLMEKFYRVQGRGLPWGKISHFMWNDIKSVDAPLLACASCGIRDIHNNHRGNTRNEDGYSEDTRTRVGNEDYRNRRRTYQEVEVKQLIDKLRLRDGDEDIEIEEDPVESNDVEEIDHGEDSNGDRGIESNDNQDKCKLTGPRSKRTQGYHRRLMEREPLCIPCNDNGDSKEVELWRLRSV